MALQTVRPKQARVIPRTPPAEQTVEKAPAPAKTRTPEKTVVTEELDDGTVTEVER